MSTDVTVWVDLDSEPTIDHGRINLDEHTAISLPEDSAGAEWLRRAARAFEVEAARLEARHEAALQALADARAYVARVQRNGGGLA